MFSKKLPLFLAILSLFLFPVTYAENISSVTLKSSQSQLEVSQPVKISVLFKVPIKETQNFPEKIFIPGIEENFEIISFSQKKNLIKTKQGSFYEQQYIYQVFPKNFGVISIGPVEWGSSISNILSIEVYKPDNIAVETRDETNMVQKTPWSETWIGGIFLFFTILIVAVWIFLLRFRK